MRKVLLFLFILLSIVAGAQTTSVTATVQYPDGSVFANGSVLATFTPPTGIIDQNLYFINGSTFPYIVTGALNGSGTFTIALTDDQKVKPQGGRWMFTICSLASTQCVNTLQDVSGASVNLSAVINASISNIIGEPTNVKRFYADSEVTTNGTGGIMYYNLTSNTYRCYNGTIWGNCATGSGGTGTVTQVNTTGPISGGPISVTGTITCPTCGVTNVDLSQFSSTTSLQLSTVISDEIGSGKVVFAAALQGTDSNLLTAGTVSASPSISLCTDANGGATTVGCPSSGSGTVTTTGTPANGNLTKFSGATSITNGDLSGDVSTSGTLATTIANNAVTQTKVLNGFVDLSSTQASIAGNKTFSGSNAEKTLNAIQFADQYSTTSAVTPPSITPLAIAASTGGAVAANNYKCEVTFVGATSGETTPSPASVSVVVTGATNILYCSHSQVPPPAGAVSYNVYWQTAGAGSFFQGHTGVALASSDIQTSTPATTGTTAPVSNTSLAVLPTVQTALGGGSGIYIIPSTVSSAAGAAGAPLSGQTIFDFRNGTIYIDPPNGGQGLLLTDAGLFNNVEQDLIQVAINGFNAKSELNLIFAPNFNATESISGGGIVSATSTTSQFNGIAGYAVDLRANPITPSVGVFGSGRAGATNARVWGGNFIGSDIGFVGTSNSIYGGENDCFIQNTGSVCRGLLIEGFWLGGIQPTASYGIEVGQPQGSVTNAQWIYGIRFDTGATVTPSGNNAAIGFFPVAAGNTQNSQGLSFYSTRSDGATPIGAVFQTPVGDIDLSQTAGGHGLTLLTAGMPLTFTEGTAAGTAAAGVDTIYGDSTSHMLKASYNNGTFGFINLASTTTTTANFPLLTTTTAGLETPSAIAYPTSASGAGVMYASSATQLNVSASIGNNKVLRISSGGVPQASSMTDSLVANLLSSTNIIQGANTVKLTANSSAITAVSPGTAVLTFGSLPVSTNLSFQCNILYNQQTAAVAGTGFAIQSATNAPTRLDASARMFTSNAGASVEGVVQNLTTTTATSLITGTPSAITTVFQTVINGTIQVGATAGTLQVLAFTGNASDSITVQAGSYCTIQ